MSRRTFLGPQRLAPNLVVAFDRFGIDGQVAAITAGWQEREGEDAELQEHLGRPVVDLELHRRLEDVFAEDQELFSLHRVRQDRLRALQRLYRYRLDFTLEPARGLLRREDGAEYLAEEQEAAIAAVRRLDAEHVERISEVHQEFEAQHRPAERRSMRRHRAEILSILKDSAAVALAGGHVAVLLNRLRLFGLPELIANHPLFAWSAGAMALAERIVLFHDSPPQGAGNAEVLDVGIGLVRGVVPLPHASTRLNLEDRVRVSLFVRRFAPDLCLLLDPGVTVTLEDDRWISLAAGRQLDREGGIEPLEEAS